MQPHGGFPLIFKLNIPKITLKLEHAPHNIINISDLLNKTKIPIIS